MLPDTPLMHGSTHRVPIVVCPFLNVLIHSQHASASSFHEHCCCQVLLSSHAALASALINVAHTSALCSGVAPQGRQPRTPAHLHTHYLATTRQAVLCTQTAHLVDVHHDDALHAAVPQHLARGGALAAAGDEHAARRRVQQHGRVHQQLVVHPLVRLRALRLAVQQQHLQPRAARSAAARASGLLCACAPVFALRALPCSRGFLHGRSHAQQPHAAARCGAAAAVWYTHSLVSRILRRNLQQSQCTCCHRMAPYLTNTQTLPLAATKWPHTSPMHRPCRTAVFAAKGLATQPTAPAGAPDSQGWYGR